MPAREAHRFVGDLDSFRFDAGARTLTGIAVPYGETVRIGGPLGFDERFAFGAFSRSVTERVSAGKVRLFGQHSRNNGQFPIGQITGAREERSGLHITAQLAQTQAAADAVELIRSGMVSGLSVGFRPVADRIATGGVVEVTEAVLLEVSVVDEPAYPGAVITALRSRFDELEELAGAPRLSVSLARRELDLLEIIENV